MPETDRPVVVVGWDFSESAGQVLAWAASYARLVGARLVLVHAVELIYTGEMAIPALTSDERGRLVDSMQQAAAAAGVEAQGEVVLASSASTALVETALAHHASLICVGRNRTGLSRLLLGSVAGQVVRSSPVPVLVVPPAATVA
jgi:nucleotide-binding universal stress UspA family protein